MRIYILVGLIAMIGSFVQSASGFGYAIICMALWPLILPFKTAAVMEVLTAFAMVLYIAIKLRKHINFKLIVWPLITSVLTSALGVAALMESTEGTLRRMLGVLLLLLAGYFVFFSDKVRIKPTAKNGLIAGAISGFCGGLFNIGGPPMVAYFLAVTDDKLEYNATLQCYFSITTIYVFALHFIMGNVAGDVVKFGLWAFGGLVIGTFLGLKLFKKITMPTLRKLVYVFMMVAGFFLIIGG